jgi:hypothetical protein
MCGDKIKLGHARPVARRSRFADEDVERGTARYVDQETVATQRVDYGLVDQRISLWAAADADDQRRCPGRESRKAGHPRPHNA